MVSVTADAPTRVMFLGVSRMLSMGLEPEQAILHNQSAAHHGAEERDAFPADDEYLRQNDPRAAAVASLPAGRTASKPVHDTV